MTVYFLSSGYYFNYGTPTVLNLDSRLIFPLPHNVGEMAWPNEMSTDNLSFWEDTKKGYCSWNKRKHTREVVQEEKRQLSSIASTKSPDRGRWWIHPRRTTPRINDTSARKYLRQVWKSWSILFTELPTPRVSTTLPIVVVVRCATVYKWQTQACKVMNKSNRAAIAASTLQY